MQKGVGIIYILVGVIILVLVAGGTFLLGRQTIPKPQSQNPVVTSMLQPTPASSPVDASPTPNGAEETANWKTYTDTKNGYSLKYPASWKQTYGKPLGKEDPNEVYFSDTLMRQSAQDKILYTGQDRNIYRFSVSVNENQNNLNAFVESQNLPESTLLKKITFNGLPAIKTLYKGQGINNVDIYVINDNKGYSIGYGFEYMNLDETSLLVPDILSTFKFTQ